MILTQYERDYTASFFMSDYDSLPYQIFLNRIYSLGGNYGEILTQRQRLISDSKMSAEERKHARKFITPEIEAYLDEQLNRANEVYAKDLLSGFANTLLGGGTNGKI